MFLVFLAMLEDKKLSDSPPQTHSINKAKTSWRAKDRQPNIASTKSSAINPAQRLSLLSEHCIPPPAPGPLTGPFVGGLPGNSPLTQRRTAPLQLAQFKAPLALTHVNNVLAFAGRAPALTSSSNTHKPHTSSAPPSPTAVAINLLNILKIVNAMSHPLYNPYTSGKQNPSQGQYGVPGGQTNLRLASPHLGPGSNFSSSRASVNLGSSVGAIPSLLNMPINYRPEKRATLDEDIERSVNLHISQAREGVKHQHPGQRSCFPGASGNELPSSVAGGTSYLSPTSFQGQRLSNVGNTNSTLDWLPMYNKVNKDNSNIFSSVSSGFAVSGDGRFNSNSEERRDIQSIPGLGDFGKAMESKSTPPSDPSQPKYTSESAISILMNFGLEKEDLEHLISYPESEITPENLPFILREIRIKKAKNTPAVVQPEPYPKPHPTASRSRVDKLGHSRGSEMNLDCVSASILKPSKVIDYGHTGKYTAGVEVGKIESSSPSNINVGMLRMDTVGGGSHSKDLQQRTLTEVKVNTSSVASCREQLGSSSISSLRSSLAPSSSTSTPIPTAQPSQYMFSMFNLPKKDTDMRQLNPEVSKSLPLKPSDPPRPLPITTEPSNTLTRGVHPQRPGLVMFDSKLKGEKKPAPNCPPPNNPPNTLQPKQQQMNQMQQPEQIPPQRRTFSAVKPFPPQPVKPGGVSVAVAPVPHQQISTLVKGVAQTPSTSMPQSKMVVSEDLPTAAMIQDYAAATPKVFPHTCSLCKKESAHLKDWISHHNTSLHIENCRLLRTRFPKWGGEVLPAPSTSSKDPKQSPSTSSQTSQSHYRKSRWSSISPSRSPRRQQGSEDRRDRRSNRSRSRSYSSDSSNDKRDSRSKSRSPRHRSESRREKRSRSRSPRSRQRRRSRTRSRSDSSRYNRHTSARYRSHSRSRERRASQRTDDEKRSPRRSRERRSSPRREDEKRSPRRSRERRSSPRREDEKRSPRRSRERRSSPRRDDEKRSPRRSRERRSSPRRDDEKRSPRRSRERRSSPRREDEKRSPRRSRERRSSPRRDDEKRSPRRSRERRSSTERSSAQRKRSSSTERLAKKLLEKTAAHSLSKQSDLEAMVKTLAPALLAELAKMKSVSLSSSAPSSSSSTSATKKGSAAKPSKVKSSPQKSETSSSGKHEGKSSPPTMVTLTGITKFVLHSEIVSAVAKIGKAKSVVIFRSKQQAVVCFEKEEDAEKLRKMKSIQVAATEVQVASEKVTGVAKETKGQNPPEHDSTTQTTKSAGKGVEPGAASGSKKPTTTKPAAEAKVAGSKATAASTNKAVKTEKTQNSAKEAAVKTTDTKKNAPEPSGPKKTKVQAKTQTANSKQTLVQKKTRKVAKPLAETASKATASKTAAADAKVSAKTPQTPKTASQSSVGAEKTMGETLKSETAQPGTAGGPSGDALTIKSETASTENPKTNPAASSDKKEAAEPNQVQIQVIANPVKPHEVKQEEPMEVEVSPDIKDFGTLPPQTTQKPTVDEPPKPDPSTTQKLEKAFTEVHQSPDPPKLETKAPQEQQTEETPAEVKAEPKQTDGEDALFVKKTLENESEAVSGTSSEAAKAIPTPETIARCQKITADPAGAAEADGVHGKITSKLSPPKHIDEQEQCCHVKAAVSAPPATSAEPPATLNVTKDTEKPAAESGKEDKIPQIDENLYKALTAALHEHKLARSNKTQSDDTKNKSSKNKDEKKQENVESEKDRLSSSIFDDKNFDLEDFVTLDEIVDVDETDAEQTLMNKTKNRSKVEPPAVKKASKCSSSSSSKSTTNSPKSTSTKNQKDSSESSKPSISSKARKTSSSSSSQSDSQLIKTSTPSSSSAGRTTRSSAAARKSEETSQKQKLETRAVKSAVTKSDHSVSAESTAVKIQDSETKIEPPSEVDSKHQMQSPRTDFQDEMSKDEKRKDTKTKEDDGEHTKEKKDYGNNKNLDDQKDASHPTSNGAPISEGIQVPEINKKENKTEADSAIELEESFTETSADDNRDNHPQQTLLPERDETHIVGESDKPAAEKEIVPGIKEADQTPSNVETDGNVKPTEDDTRTEESSKTSADSEQTSDDRRQPVDPVDADTAKDVETLSHQQAKAEDEATEEEDVEYHVIDAIEDLPTTTESETDISEEQMKISAGGQGECAARKSGQKSKTLSDEKEESPKKRDRKATKTETQIKKEDIRRDIKMEDTEDDLEDIIFEVLDSVEDESVLEDSTLEMLDQKTLTGAREEKTQSVKGSAESSKEEGDPEKKAGMDERSVSTRSTRGRKTVTQKDDVSSRRSTPARESRGRKEKVPKIEGEAPLKESVSTEKTGDVKKDTGEEDPAFSTLRAPEEEVLQNDQPPVQEKPRRGRPKKNTKRAKKQAVAPKKVESSVKEVEEDEEEFQIIDSVEEEAVDVPAFTDQTESTGTLSFKVEKTKPETTTGLLLNEEEEPLYQILDSVEDDALQEELAPTEASSVEVEEDTKEKSLIKSQHRTAVSPEYQRKCQLQLPENIKGRVDSSSIDISKDTTQKTGAQKEEEPPSSSQSGKAASAPTESDTMSRNALKNLDEVSEEEEDYPDDTAEEEELNKKLAAVKEREKAREEKRARDRGDHERKSRSRGRSHRSQGKVDLETQELVTLDEVGGDDAGESDFEGLDMGVMEGELQDLVTLDEITEEEEEEGRETRIHEIQEGQSENLLKPETSAASEESTITEDQKSEKEAAEKSPSTAKRKHHEDADESSNFRVVDDLRNAEDEEKTAPTPRPRGRPKKKSRQTAVRKSARGKESSTEEEKKDEELESLDLSSTVDKEISGSLGDDKTEIQKPEEDMEDKKSPDVHTTSKMQNDWNEHTVKLKGNKRQQELIGPESKRARSESPSVPSHFLLPPYNPNSPIGQEHVVLKLGFFCNICSIFYLTEKAAKEVHCSSQMHYENLQKHHKKLQWKSSRTQSSQGSVSD